MTPSADHLLSPVFRLELLNLDFIHSRDVPSCVPHTHEAKLMELNKPAMLLLLLLMPSGDASADPAAEVGLHIPLLKPVMEVLEGGSAPSPPTPELRRAGGGFFYPFLILK